jgi:hypothetical protein
VRACVQSFSVLIMAHHSAHQAYGSRYDLNLYRQLKKVGIPIVDVCHPDCTEIETLVTRTRSPFARFVALGLLCRLLVSSNNGDHNCRGA